MISFIVILIAIAVLYFIKAEKIKKEADVTPNKEEKNAIKNASKTARFKGYYALFFIIISCIFLIYVLSKTN